MAENRYIKYTVKEDILISDFLSDENSLVANMTREQFLRIKDANGNTNAKLIYDKYNKKDRENQLVKDQYSQFDLYTMLANTTVTIPISEYQEELLVIGGENLFLDQNQSLPAFFVDKQKQLQSDPKYVKLEVLTQPGSNVDVQTIEQNCQVWIYVKSIDKLIDVSPFVNSLNISKSDIGGFSINVNPIEIQIDRDSNNITSVFISSDNGREYLKR